VLGHEQLEWLEDDLKGRSNSTPIVLFAHVPLWTFFQSGWEPRQRASLGLPQAVRLRDVLKGISINHPKSRGNITFHTPCPRHFRNHNRAPRQNLANESAGGKVRSVGFTSVNYVKARNFLR